MSTRLAAVALSTALVLPAVPAAAQDQQQPVYVQEPTGQTFGIDNRLLGQIGGALGGALLGSQLGDGTGQVAATAVGGLLGFLLGGEVAERLSPPARQEIQRAERRALEEAPIGQPVQWESPVEEDVYGTITPIRQGWTGSGRLCRQFEQVVYIGGQPERAVGTACRTADGTWALVPPDQVPQELYAEAPPTESEGDFFEREATSGYGYGQDWPSPDAGGWPAPQPERPGGSPYGLYVR